MKTRNIIFLFLIIFSFHSFAEGEADEKAQATELIEAVQDSIDVGKVVSAVGTLPPSCAHCPDKVAHQKIIADKKEIDIGNPYYLRNNEPYVVRLIRSEKTPKKLKLKFKNGYKVCRKFIAEPNPWVNGKWVMGCWIEGHDYIDNDLEVDFSDLPPMKENESEIVEIKFFKSHPDKTKYTVSAEILKDQAHKAEVSPYFWGAGYNVKFSSARRDP